MIRVKKEDFINKPSEEVINACLRMNVNPFEAKKAERWQGGRSFLFYIGAASWVKMSLDCEKNIKTKLFLAIGGQVDVELLTGAYETFLKDQAKF